MNNSSLLIYSILKNLEKLTFSVLKIGNKLEKEKEKIKKTNEGTLSWLNSSKMINKYNQQLIDNMNIKNIKDSIFKINSICNFNRTNKNLINRCKTFYNDIENGYYTHNDFIISYLHEALFVDKHTLIKLNKKRIKEIKKTLTAKQFNIDKEFLLSINKSPNNIDYHEFFKINNDGKNIIYDLIKNEYITTIFYLFFYRKYLTNTRENINFNTCKEYLHFERILNIILKYLN